MLNSINSYYQFTTSRKVNFTKEASTPKTSCDVKLFERHEAPVYFASSKSFNEIDLISQKVQELRDKHLDNAGKLVVESLPDYCAGTNSISESDKIATIVDLTNANANVKPFTTKILARINLIIQLN